MTKRVNTQRLAAATGVVIVTLSAQQAHATTSSSVHLDSTAATQLITTTTVSQMLSISNALLARSMTRMGPPAGLADSGERVGMAAGGASDKFNVWSSLSWDNTRYDDGTNLFGANANNKIIGADYALNPALSVGLSVASDDVDGTSGTTAARNKYSSTGYSFAPYLGWQINKDWSLDASLGWGSSRTYSGATDESDRFFYGTSINYTQWYGNWQVAGKGSLMHGEEKFAVRGNNPSFKNKVNQYRVGGQAGYWMDGVMPYAALAYSTDAGRGTTGPTTVPDNLGKNAWVMSLGVNFISMKNGVTGGVAYNHESGRSNGKSSGLLANLNVRF